jgi:phage terminase large subunit-like protein
MLLESIKKEYDLHFESSDLMVFKSNLIESTCHLNQFDNEVKENSNYYITLDTASFGVDYLVAMVFESKGDHYCQVEMYREKQNLQYQISKLSELIKKYNPIKVGIETNGVGEVYIEALKVKHPKINFVKICTTLSSKAIMIEKLNNLFEQNKISLFNDSEIKKEFLFFQSGSAKNSDDIVMAISFLTELI